MLSLSLAAKLFFIIILNILNGGIMVCNEEAASEKNDYPKQLLLNYFYLESCIIPTRLWLVVWRRCRSIRGLRRAHG